MKKVGWKHAVAGAAILSVMPAAAMAANAKAKPAGTAQIYNVTADADVVPLSTAPMDVVVCNASDTLGKGYMKKPDVDKKEGFAVPARACAIVGGTYLLELDTSDTPGPWTAIVSVTKPH
jgi:hypothetical protein